MLFVVTQRSVFNVMGNLRAHCTGQMAKFKRIIRKARFHLIASQQGLSTVVLQLSAEFVLMVMRSSDVMTHPRTSACRAHDRTCTHVLHVLEMEGRLVNFYFVLPLYWCNKTCSART
eukprot:jgi/Botrbrau1/9998/Bobra.0012s0087.1